MSKHPLAEEYRSKRDDPRCSQPWHERMADRMADALDSLTEERDRYKAALADLTHRSVDALADLEICMAALDRLAYVNTFGPCADIRQFGEAGMNEMHLRAEYADAQRKRTQAWKQADAETDAALSPGGKQP